jgi:hypothetical protein
MATLKEYRDMMFYARSIAALYTTALNGAAAPLACWQRQQAASKALPLPSQAHVGSSVCRHVRRTART